MLFHSKKVFAIFLCLLLFTPSLAGAQSKEGTMYNYDFVLTEMVLTIWENGQPLIQLPFEEENPSVAFLSFDQKSFFSVYSNSVLTNADGDLIHFFSLPTGASSLFATFSGDFSSLFVSSLFPAVVNLQLKDNSFLDMLSLLSTQTHLQGNGQINSYYCTEEHSPYQNAAFTTYVPKGQISQFEQTFTASFPKNLYYQWVNSY